jgi:hypothetical protein
MFLANRLKVGGIGIIGSLGLLYMRLTWMPLEDSGTCCGSIPMKRQCSDAHNIIVLTKKCGSK